MGIGNILRGIFNGVKDVAENLPGVGSVVKQGEDTLGQIGKTGNSLFDRGENTPSSYNTQEAAPMQAQEAIGTIGNLPQLHSLSENSQSGANAAKAAASDVAAAEDIAKMLV
jgi:hypothetical protein